MRTLLLLLSLACCLHCVVDGASLNKNSHSKLAGHHPTHKREEVKITHHRALTPFQKKSEQHVKAHHVTVDKKEASGLTAKTVNLEKVKRFLARIPKSAEAVKHQPVHTQKVTGETKRHLKTVQKKHAASQKKRSGKIDVENMKKALGERTAATGSETQTRRLLHALLNRLARRRELMKRQGGRGPPPGKPKPPPCEEGHPGYKPDGHPRRPPCKTTTAEPSTTEATTSTSTTEPTLTDIKRRSHAKRKEGEERKKRVARKGIERAAATGSETLTRRLLHTLLSRLTSRKHLKKRQDEETTTPPPEGTTTPSEGTTTPSEGTTPTGRPKPPPCREGHRRHKPDGCHQPPPCTRTTTEPSTTEATTSTSTTEPTPSDIKRRSHAERKEEKERKKRVARKGWYDYEDSDEDDEDYSYEDYDDNDYETGTEEPHEDFDPEYDYDDLDFGDDVLDFGDYVPDFGDDVPDFGDYSKLPVDITLVNSNAGKNVVQGVGSIFHTGETDAGETDAPTADTTTPGVEPSTTPLT